MEYEPGIPRVTKDGVTIIKNVWTGSGAVNVGVGLMKSVSGNANKHSGDGTTSSTLVSSALLRKGAKVVDAGVDPRKLRRGIQRAAEATREFLNQMAIANSQNPKLISAAAKIAANGDEALAEAAAKAVEAVGPNGVVYVEPGAGGKTEAVVLDFGALLRGASHQGFLKTPAETAAKSAKSGDQNSSSKPPSPPAANNLSSTASSNIVSSWETESGEPVADFSDPSVLLYLGELRDAGVVEACLAATGERPLVIFCADAAEPLLAQLIFRVQKANLKLCVVTVNFFGDYQHETFEDLAALFEAQVFSPSINHPIKTASDVSSFLGRARRIRIDSSETRFWSLPSSSSSKLQSRLLSAHKAFNLSSATSRSLALERLSRLGGRQAVIRLASGTQASLNEAHDKLIDALNASRAAATAGALPGGGAALLHASFLLDFLPLEDLEERLGARIFAEAIKEPFVRIAENGGGCAPLLAEQIRAAGNTNFGYDARKEKVVDLVEAGVVDPLSNVICAVEDAESIAGLVLTCEVVVTEKTVYSPPKLNTYPSNMF